MLWHFHLVINSIIAIIVIPFCHAMEISPKRPVKQYSGNLSEIQILNTFNMAPSVNWKVYEPFISSVSLIVTGTGHETRYFTVLGAMRKTTEHYICNEINIFSLYFLKRFVTLTSPSECKQVDNLLLTCPHKRRSVAELAMNDKVHSKLWKAAIIFSINKIWEIWKFFIVLTWEGRKNQGKLILFIICLKFDVHGSYNVRNCTVCAKKKKKIWQDL